jgi:hypothetical protein
MFADANWQKREGEVGVLDGVTKGDVENDWKQRPEACLKNPKEMTLKNVIREAAECFLTWLFLSNIYDE